MSSGKSQLRPENIPMNSLTLGRRKFLLKISGMVRVHGMPDELVLFNCDQTGFNLVLAGNWTLERKGERRGMVCWSG